MTPAVQVFRDDSLSVPVCGWLHRPEQTSDRGLVLTHGAGSNSKTSLLISLADSFAGGWGFVVCCDLPFLQNSSFCPPRPGGAARDCGGFMTPCTTQGKHCCGQVFLGGHFD